MCGIVGMITNSKLDTYAYTLDRLSTLEYRGYDSFGIVGENMDPRKFIGSISRTDVKGLSAPEDSVLAIAHTRWATHGVVNHENTHPHVSHKKNFAVVHNGVISNHKSLRQQLESSGVDFYSDTDSEVIPNLLELEHTRSPLSTPEEIMRRTLIHLEGEFAILAISRHWPDTLVCVKNQSPLVAGFSPNICVVASDESALAEDFKTCVHLEDMEIITLIREDDCTFASSSKTVGFKDRFERISANTGDEGKGEFPDFMSKEMSEIPNAIRNATHTRLNPSVFNERRLLLSGCGSAYYAAWIGQSLRRSLNPLADTTAHPADELDSINTNVFDAALFISQSGETFDVLNPLKTMDNRIITACISNVSGSRLVKSVDIPIIQNAGVERCVLSTKSILSQCSLLYRLFGGDSTVLNTLADAWDSFFGDLEFSQIIKDLAHSAIDTDHYFHIGRGILHPVAMENALKLKEVTYCHAEGMAAGFFKHGTLSLIDERFITFAHLPSRKHDPALHDLTEANISEIESRGGRVIRVGHEHDHDFTLPDVSKNLNALLHLGFGQHYAYYKAKALLRDVDQPRSLAKSVTVR